MKSWRQSKRPTTRIGTKARRRGSSAARHFGQHPADYDLILAGDHLYRMDYADLVNAHKRLGAEITIAAQPVDLETATQMGIFLFDSEGNIVAFEEKPKPARLEQIRRSIPEGSTFAEHSDEQPFMASMGVYVFTRRVLLDMLEHEPGHDFGRSLIPNALGRYKVKSYQFRGYWAMWERSNRSTRPTSCSAASTHRFTSGIGTARSTPTCDTCPDR